MERVRNCLVLLEQRADGHVGCDCSGVRLRAGVLFLDQAGLLLLLLLLVEVVVVMVLWLGQGGLVQEVNECLLRFLLDTLTILA